MQEKRPLRGKKVDGRVRPTMAKVRDAIFSMIGPEATHGLQVADLYAGTGSMGERALKNGAAHVDFVEKDARLCKRVELQMLKRGFAGTSKVHRGDVLKVLPRLNRRYDVVFADPPYGGEPPFEKVFEGMCLLNLLSEGCVAFLEHGANVVMGENLPGLQLRARKRYGDTAVTVYDAVSGKSV